MFFVYDTETTGLPNWNTPSDGPDQPHIVELAGLLCDEDENLTVISQISLIAKPDGWVIPDEVAEIHGIDTGYAAAVGVPEPMILDIWWKLAERATRIGHNLVFDDRIMRIAAKRFRPGTEDEIKAWAKIDTAHGEVRKFCNLPPTEKMMATGRKSAKPPTLEELHGILYPDADPLKDLHGAMMDTRVLRKCVVELRKRGII